MYFWVFSTLDVSTLIPVLEITCPRYIAAHEQLDSPRVSHASTRTHTHEYSYKYTRVLEHAHAGTRASTRTCTRAHSNTCKRFTRSGHARLVPRPSTFFWCGRSLGTKLWIRVHVYCMCSLLVCTRVHSNIHTQVARVSHACGFRVTRE